MAVKKQPGKKVLDISKPKKRPVSEEVPGAPQLVIPKRSLIPVVEATEIPSFDQTVTKREAASVEPPAVEQTQAEPAKKTPVSQTPPPPGVSAETSPPIEKDTSTSPEADDKASSDKAAPHVRKALDDAKRQNELQGYIDNRDFYVPINAVARKRSLKVSLVLTLLELALGILLLNLMLDAGLIQLLEKIPHTNFFNLQ